MLHELDIRFRCSISSVLLNDEYCELLYHAGCREVGIGFESADDDILKLINKAGNLYNPGKFMGFKNSLSTIDCFDH